MAVYTTLINKGLVRADYTSVFIHGQKVNGNLLYTLKPIEQVFREQDKYRGHK